MGDSAKTFTEVEISNIHCSPLIHEPSHLIVEGYKVIEAIYSTVFPECKLILLCLMKLVSSCYFFNVRFMSEEKILTTPL